MTTQTKIPRHVEFELDLRSLLEGLAERGRLCDDAVEQEADAALGLLRRIDGIAMTSKSGHRCSFEARGRALEESIQPPITDDDLPEDTDDALTPAE